MTVLHFALRSVAFYRRSYLAVVFGVASAVAVLAGSLMVGASVRGSLASIAIGRLGRTDVAVVAERPFGDGLADRLRRQSQAASAIAHAAPVLALQGVVRHPASGRRATRVSVYGVDERFFTLHGSTSAPPAESELRLSPALAQELGAAPGDDLLVRVARPTDVPVDSLHGRKDEIGRTLRLRTEATAPAIDLREFSLAPGQAPVRAVFVALSRLQRDLDIRQRANTLLVHGATGASPAPAVIAALPHAIGLEDLGLTLRSADDRTVIVESSSGLIPDAIAAALDTGAARASLVAEPVLTWLANAMSIGGRAVPYSTITALGPRAGGDAALAALLQSAPDAPPPIVLTAWTAADLQAKTGDALDLEYYRWTDEGRLASERSSFRVAGVVPMTGLAVDRQLAPDYPGISTSKRFADWDPPFPIDLSHVRPEDEAYWDRYRTAPKAFIPLHIGQRLWKSRHGQVTSIRVRGDEKTPEPRARELLTGAARDVNLVDAGLMVLDVRAQSVAASAGATDFGAYFSYFSFFLMASALLLSGLFFRLSLEERQSQIGVLRAAGLTARDVRRVLITEGVLVVAPAVVLGAGLAIGWAALMMYGLRTWWVDAVGTTLLTLHVDAALLAMGAAGGAAAAIVAIMWTVRAASRATPRALLSGAIEIDRSARRSRSRAIALAAIIAALAASALGGLGIVPAAGAFFGAGTLVLIAGLAGFNGWLKARPSASSKGRLEAGSPRARLVRLGLANASWRPGRSLTSVGLVAAAVFLLVSVDAFRKRVDAGAAASGTGGFALLAESELPIVHDLSSPDGWRAAGLDVTPASPLSGVTLLGLRLRPGDDASCLNLYQPRRPRIVGVPERMVDVAPFRFARSLAATDAERANPWRLLGPAGADGVVPAIVDATSLQYVLHAAVGDVMTVDADTARPIRLRVVGSLDDSVLQGEILIGEAAFRQLFAELPGYRVFLAAVPNATAEGRAVAARELEDALADFGFDAEDAARRLEAFHRVENTYLSTFQALGGLGLALGCLGLVAVVARNVLERRRELALLGASGFTGGDLRMVVAAEHVALVAVGLVVGVAAALVAVAPVVYARGGALPWSALVWLAPVALAGLASALLATRRVRRLPLVPSLRTE